MPKQAVVRTIPLVVALIILMFPRIPRAQSDPPKQSTAAQKQDWWLHHEKWDTPVPDDKSVYVGRKSEPAPRRDLSGTWDGFSEGGTQAKGAKEFPDDFRHLPDVPYTALGKAARMANKAGEGEERCVTCRGCRSIQPLHPNVLVVHFALGIVGLKGKRSFT